MMAPHLASLSGHFRSRLAFWITIEQYRVKMVSVCALGVSEYLVCLSEISRHQSYRFRPWLLPLIGHRVRRTPPACPNSFSAPLCGMLSVLACLDTRLWRTMNSSRDKYLALIAHQS